ncbi:Acetyl-coenzyme A synthetase [[Actinomadura] parvosata subsp. kistnae]|uniref:Propionyl-CoA synthetase n=1 Tax=[Actinomadura] parvosata subsp. kistnae TaxID=1909395 RepID=A0A1V0A1Y3_9ACTN|nr:propionyl-CoA synthetase [Nonomuraea sp. ATCC 55076]AQZ64162.1 propionyl-CoA synthetase [Nonomuraea sp. ATCC 55076]SPL87352.1 Acetyl-coenzyme A synthetase [Actinomadura parvosata subsp. kistnae]
MSGFDEVYRRSIEQPEQFWGEAARGIDWDVPPATVYDRGRWFPDGRLNTCHNAVDRHIERGRGAQPALIHDSPVTGTTRVLTYAELRDEVARTAGMLRDLGVTAGDTVVIYLPMVPEAVVAMLACARLGAVHSVVFGGFAARELAVRIDHARPKVVLSASCGIEPARVVAYKPLLDDALEQAEHQPDRCVILQRPQCAAELREGRDLDWAQAVRGAEPAPCVSVAATDPLYILYTSGTTGSPKGVVRDNGGHAVALHWSMAHVYGAAPGEVYWAASDVGWVVGHSYIVYAPLLAGCTTVLYEGKPVGTPDPGAFWRVVATHGVRTLFTAPTAIRAIKKEDPSGAFAKKWDLSGLRHLFLAGERLDPDTYHWAADLLGVPVIDHWWQTETGWPIAANCVGIEPLPIKPGSPTKAVPGWDVHVLDSDGDDCPPGVEGAVTVKLPLPPGALPTLYRDEARFTRSYLERYPGHYLTGDGGHLDEDGYLYVMGRIDDVINVAGHRLSTGAMEEVIASHPDVAECAVIGVADELKGQLPMGFVVLKAGARRDPDDVERELAALVRERIGPVAAFRRAVVVTRLPKTRSGKILRATMRDIADGNPYDIPSTIEDPGSLPEIAQALKGT